MKKLALLLVLALALVPVLASCNNSEAAETETETAAETVYVPEELSFTDLYKTDYAELDNEVFNLAEGKALEGLMNTTYSHTAGDLLVFYGTTYNSGDTKIAAYNVKTGEVVYKLVYEEAGAEVTTTATISSYNGVAFIIEKKDVTSLVSATTTTTYTLYDATATQLATKENTTFEISSLANDLIAIDGKVYSVEDDELNELFELGMKKIPYCSVLTDKYNYEFSDDKVLVYDQEFDLVTYTKGDANADDTSFFVLNNGNILVINYYELLDEAEEYDFAVGIEKYNVDHFVFDVESGESTYYELDFVVQYAVSGYSYPEFNKLLEEGVIENLAYVTPIINKTLSDSMEDCDLVNLSNELVILATIEDIIPNQENTMPEPIAEDRYLISNVAGQQFLIDGNGKILGEVSADVSDDLSYAYNDVFASLFVDNLGNVYDYDLNKLFNYKTGDYECLDGLLFRTKDGTSYAVLTKTGFVSLSIDPSVVQSYYTEGDAICFYTYEEINGEYGNYTTLVNEAGSVILKIQTGSKAVANGYAYTYIEGTHSSEAGILITVRIDTTTDEYDNYGYYMGTTTTTTYKTYFCADNVPA